MSSVVVWVYIWILQIICSSTQIVQYYVSRNGIDSLQCGNSTNPCGTLYYTSLLITESSNTIHEVHIIDGQNITQIQSYQQLQNTNNWNPCLPKEFDPSKSITITFNPQNITDLQDWYPIELCNTTTNYKNTYLIDGGHILNVNNLIINDYIISSTSNYNYLIIKANISIDPIIHINNCSFTNIISSTSDAPFLTYGSISIKNSQFINITLLSDVIYADHKSDYTESSRNFLIMKTTFESIAAPNNFYAVYSYNDVSNVPCICKYFCLKFGLKCAQFRYGTTLNILESSFTNINVTDAVINDGTFLSDTYIANTSFDIRQGIIYKNNHEYESNIQIYDIFLRTIQVNENDGYGLFNFGLSDYIFMTNIKIIYEYDVILYCDEYDAINYIINNGARAELYSCVNPIMFLYNNGIMEIHGIDVDINLLNIDAIHPLDTNYYNLNLVTFHYKNIIGDKSYSSFILNQGVLSISYAVITNTICNYFINNLFEITLSNISILQTTNGEYNPNILHSTTAIAQDGSSEAFITAENVNILGCGTGFLIQRGTASITRSSIQNAAVAVSVSEVTNFTLDNCQIINNGLYYGRFPSYFDLPDITSGFQVKDTTNVVISNTIFSGFDNQGLIYIATSSFVVFSNNIISVDDSALFYNISKKWKQFQGYGVLTYELSNDTTTINNRFTENILDPKNEWIFFNQTNGINCLSGNMFTNYAIYASSSNITSCFRPGIIERISNNKTVDWNDLTIVPDLFDDDTHIYVNSSSEYGQIFFAESSNIALDNVNISTTNLDPVIVAVNGAILLMDSYIMYPFDLIYYAGLCNVSQNDRVSNNSQYISSLLLRCRKVNGSEHFDKVYSSMNSPITKFTSYLNPVQLMIMTESNTYYPGGLLTFTHHFLDKLGNIVPNNLSDDVSIAISHDSFATNLKIQQDNICPLCNDGILINTVSIDQNLGDNITLDLSISGNPFYASQSEISLNIGGCPIMHGPGGLNFTCSYCPAFQYNLDSENVHSCKSCDPDINPTIKCGNGNINILENYWIGFHGDTLISGACPASQCCQIESGCSYFIEDDYTINENILCALNRDYTSPLCGQCKPGYSESMNSNNCIKCEKEIYWEYLIYPVMIALLWSVYTTLITAEALPSNKNSTRNLCDCLENVKQKISDVLSHEFLLMKIKLLINGIIIYYEQALSQILSGGSDSYSILFGQFIQTFNLSFTSINTGSDGDDSCFIKGLNAKQKILTNLISPSLIFTITIFIHLFVKCLTKGDSVIFKRRLDFQNTLIELSLMMIGNVLSVLFQLLNCETVGDKSYHFYFGFEQCYGITWIISFSAIFVIIILFGAIFIKLQFMDDTHRQSEEKNIFYSFVEQYKPQYWYWEFIIFIRRIAIALFSGSVNDDISTILFVVVMAVFLYIHNKCDPFLINSGNEMERILLQCLIFVIVSNALSSTDNAVFQNYFISFMIIFPMLLFIYIMYKHWQRRKDGKNGDGKGVKSSIDLREERKIEMQIRTKGSGLSQPLLNSENYI